jgi:hypothetical protein
MYRPWKSYAPDFIDALVAFLKTATASTPDLQIRDGPWISAETASNVVCIGWAGFPTGVTRPATQMQEELGGNDITSTGVPEGLGPSILETMLIACSALSRDGTGNVSACRRLAYSNAATVGNLISTAGGSTIFPGVSHAIMGTQVGLHEVQERRGAMAVVTFTIEAKAYAQQ